MNTATTCWWATWHTGPDAGATFELTGGRHVLGRAHTADLRCDDSALQPHHALLEVQADGGLAITQLAGRAPMMVAPGLRSLAAATPAIGTVVLADSGVVEVGGSTIGFARCRERLDAAELRADALVRQPRAVPEWTPHDLHPPEPLTRVDDSGGGLLPAILGVAGAGAIAIVLHQPMFLLFGAMGAVLAVGSSIAQRVATRRKRRQAAATHAVRRVEHDAALTMEVERYRAFLLGITPTMPLAHRACTERCTELWARRSDHADAYMASVGIGDVALPEVLARREADAVGIAEPGMPVAAHLGPGARVAVRGPQAHAIAHALVVQVATSCGPADLRVVVVTEQPGAWDCLRQFPHLGRPDGTAAVVTDNELPSVLADLAAHEVHVLLVTDQPALLATRTSPLRRALADPTRAALLAVIPGDAGVSHLCTSVLTTSSGPLGRWVVDTRATMLPAVVRVAGISERTAFLCAAGQRGLIDPEDPLGTGGDMPRDVSLVALLAESAGTTLTPASIAAQWAHAGHDPHPRTVIGMATDGAVDIDLVRDGPHALIAGTTGAGKSELLRSLVAGMAATIGPEHLTFVLVDYKGGATFDACAALPHVAGVVTDLDDHLADRALRSLHAELRRREAMLRDHQAADLPTLRRVAPHVVLPRLVVVIDEFAALVAEQPDFLHALVGVAQRGRSLGVHLILATQRPNGVISDDIRANTNLRLALRLHDSADALDVVGIAAPAQLPKGLPGRAVMRLGADDHLTFQTAQCTAPHDAALRLLVRTIADAAVLTGAVAAHAPWQPPLPATVSRDDLAPGELGLVDDPDRQRVDRLRWSPADGHVLVAASPGAGATSTLHTLAGHVLAGREGHVTTHLYVLDGRSDGRLRTLEGHPRCGGVVQLYERERVMRLLHLLRRLVRTPRASHPVRTVLLVDGLDTVRRSLDDVDTVDELEALDEVLANADHAGITIVASVEQVSAVPGALLARCAHRWVMHLHDPHDVGLLGVDRARAIGVGTPGRFVDAASGRTVQMVVPGPPPLFRVCSTVAAAPAIVDVAATVHATSLQPGRRHDGITCLPLGVDFATGDAHDLVLPDREAVLVVGGARTGRSTALARIAHAWRDAHPDGWVVALVPRRSAPLLHPGVVDSVATDSESLVDLAAGRSHHGRPMLVLVDDAELVDDTSGALATLVAGGDAWLVAAGRPDALRQRYGHWTNVVRRSRMGVLLTGGSDLDADLLATVVPRRLPTSARPGLAWVVDNGSNRLVQLAIDGLENAARGDGLQRSAAQ